MRGRRTLEETAAMIERRRSGGLISQAFCEAENINVATYYYWNQRLRLKESEETSVLVPINIEKSGRRCEADMENPLVRICNPHTADPGFLILFLVFLRKHSAL